MVVVVQGRSACAHRMTERRPRPSWQAPSASRHRTSTCWSRGARPNGRCCWLPFSRKTSPCRRTRAGARDATRTEAFNVPSCSPPATHPPCPSSAWSAVGSYNFCSSGASVQWDGF